MIVRYVFSPTGGTEKISALLTENQIPEATRYDLSDRDFQGNEREGTDVAFFCVPVFGGRVPEPAIAAIKKCKGNGACAAAVVVYGNRAIDDALLELQDTLIECGFAVIGAAAFVTRHSILEKIAADRPTESEQQSIKAFAQAVLDKSETANRGKLLLPGKRPYKEHMTTILKPKASRKCTKCGVCVLGCPVHAIPAEDPRKTEDNCIGCMRCIVRCPHQARELPLPIRLAVAHKLGSLQYVRNNNQTWL